MYSRLGSKVALACALLAPCKIWSQTSLSGYVRRSVSNAPIDDASLVLDGAVSTRSGSDGHYVFERVTRGTHVVSVRAVGYKEIADTMLIDSSATQTLRDFRLERIAVLDSVISTAAERKYISPALQGFEERRKTGFGHFVTDSILRREESEPMADILKAHVTGLRVIHYKGEDYAVATHATTNHSAISDRGPGAGMITASDGQRYPDECYVTVYVDGTRRYDKAEALRAPPPALGSFFTTDLGGVEFYSGSATLPPQFQSKGGCGALLLWTRER